MSLETLDPLKRFASYVRDLLNIDESMIALGRANEYDQQRPTLIIVDNLAPARELNISKKFDADAEIQTFVSAMEGLFTVNFYGDQAYEFSHIFSGLNTTQEAKDLQKKHCISTYRQQSLTNLKQLAGKTYHERYEITLKVSYNNIITHSTKRFDTAQLDFNFNL